jgi:hypothetical protein
MRVDPTKFVVYALDGARPGIGHLATTAARPRPPTDVGALDARGTQGACRKGRRARPSSPA